MVPEKLKAGDQSLPEKLNAGDQSFLLDTDEILLDMELASGSTRSTLCRSRRKYPSSPDEVHLSENSRNSSVF